MISDTCTCHTRLDTYARTRYLYEHDLGYSMEYYHAQRYMSEANQCSARVQNLHRLFRFRRWLQCLVESAPELVQRQAHPKSARSQRNDTTADRSKRRVWAGRIHQLCCPPQSTSTSTCPPQSTCHSAHKNHLKSGICDSSRPSS